MSPRFNSSPSFWKEGGEGDGRRPFSAVSNGTSSVKMNRREFEKMALEVMDELPDVVLSWLDNVGIVVEDWPTKQQLKEMGIADRRDLLGLYLGTPLVERENGFPGLPDQIVLFQGPIEAAGVSRDGVRDEIRATILHEVAHHFGMGEDKLEDLGLG